MKKIERREKNRQTKANWLKLLTCIVHNDMKKIRQLQYQFIFNGDFKQIHSSSLTSILIMFIDLGWKKGYNNPLP